MTDRLAPSVISADVARLADSLRPVEPHADRWHVDVMDGHYVPNLTIGPMFVEALAGTSPLPQDLHLMVANPRETWSWYAKAGAARIAFHPEADDDPGGLLRVLADAAIGPGLAVNPDVPVEAIEPYLDRVDHLVMMSVFPGFSGQKFIPDVLPKLRELRLLLAERGRQVDLIVDGGVNLETAPRCVEAGADVLVSASAIFGSDDPGATAAALRRTFER